MRRRVVLVAMLLIAGAIVNVAVAWTLPNYTSLTWSDDGPPNVDDIDWWQANAPAGRDVPDAPARVIRQRAFGWHIVYMIEVKRTERSQPTGHTCDRKMLGWPMLSLQSNIWDDPTERDTVRGIATFLPMSLPTEPIWPGFAINTIFYAAILWAVSFGPGAVRRTIRRRRELCPACAYPIGTSPVCTECGAELPSPSR